MTRTFVSRLVSLAAMLALASGLSACNSSGLTAQGHATVTTGSGASSTSTGFSFSGPMRLDGGAGTTTGMCQISRGSGPGIYGVVVDLYGNSQATGRAARSITIMAQTASPQSGQITADLGGDDFTSGAGCTLEVTSLDEGHGNVNMVGQCPLTFGSETAAADISLSLSGCTVM